MSRFALLRGVGAGALTLALALPASAQQPLPNIDVNAAQRQAHAPRARAHAVRRAATAPAAAPVAAATTGAPAEGGGSLTVPSVAAQRAELDRNVGSVAFVDGASRAIQTRFVFDLHDALKDTPGVYSQSRYGQELRLSVRGSNLTRDYHLRGLELLQDGVPMNYADGGGDFYQIDPKFFRSIEVLKGGNALSVGSSTLGGAVNFVSPTAHTALAPNIIAIDGGSFGARRFQGQVSRVLGNFDFLVNGTYSHADGFRIHSQSDYTQINANAGYRFSNNAETRFYFGFYNTWQKLPGQLPLSAMYAYPNLSVAPFPGGAGSDGFSGDQARNVRNWRIANKTTFDTEFGRFDVAGWYINTHLYHPIFVVLEQQGETWGFAPKLTKTFEIAGHKDEIVAGGRVWGGSTTDRWSTNFNGVAVNPYGLVPANFGTAAFSFPPFSWNGLARYGAASSCFGFCGYWLNPGADPRLRDNVATALNLEAFFENRFYVTDQLSVMSGAKFFADTRRYTVRGDIPFDPVRSSQEIVYRGLNPKIGVMYEATPDMKFFADVTGSRDVPDFIDLTQGYFPPNQIGSTNMTPLVAQKAWTGEIGSRGKWDRFSWDVTFYHTELQDELLKFNRNPGAGVPAATFNAPRTMHQGVELAASVELMRHLLGAGIEDSLKLTQVWTWNDYRFVGDNNYRNNAIAGIPAHVLRTTLAYNHPSGLYVAPSVDWVPHGAYVDYQNTMSAPGYALLGLQAGMQLPYGVSLYAEARNLANVKYVSDVSTIQDARGTGPTVLAPGDPPVFYPGAGRSIYAGMRWAF